MCRNIRFVIAFDLLVAFIFPNFTVFSHYVENSDRDRSDAIFFPGDYHIYKPPPSVDYTDGSKCTLVNGSRGICRKSWDCRVDTTYSRRCGYDRYTELICCPETEQEQTIVQKPPRPIYAPVPPSRIEQEQASMGKLPRPIHPAPATEIPEQTIEEPSSPLVIPEPSEEEDSTFSITVFNGREAEKREFPYMAALGYTNNEMGEAPFKYSCGGSLISTRLVLTAAHCVRNRDNIVPVHVLLGTTDLVKRDTNAQMIEIAKIDPHKEYRIGSFNHDLAIITLKSDVSVTSYVVPIHLPTLSLNSTILQNKEFKTIGFGVTEEGELSNTLIATHLLSIVSQAECNQTYSGIRQLERGILDTMICVRDNNRTRGSDACEGDSGGPLIMSEKNRNDTDIIIGVTAFGVPCGFTLPGVYTAVYPYLSWIDQFIWQKFDSVVE